ncbi:MAG: ABC transporter permease [Candidatus Thorarchaeota archaeon]
METDVSINNGNGAMIKLLSIVQVIFVMASMLIGGILVLGNMAYTIQGWLGAELVVPVIVSEWVLQGLILLVLSFFLLRANQGVMNKVPDAFSSSFYIYVLLTIVFATLGSYGFILIIVVVFQLLLMFLPSVRYYWFQEFVEDTKPRVKETRFTLHLVRKSPLVVVGILIIAFMCGLALSAPWTTTYSGTHIEFDDARLPPGSPSNEIKQNYEYHLEDVELDPEIMPEYYYEEIEITEKYLQTPEIPRLFIGVSDLDTGFDAVDVNVTFRIYNLPLTEYEAMTASERLSYLYANRSVVNDHLIEYIELPNEEGVYIWELQFIAQQKTSEWSANTRVVISYFSIYPDHIFGTDNYGGDIYSRLIWGAGEDLKIALSVVFVAVTVGAVIGAASGYFGGKLDELVMRITDIFFAFPGLVLAMAIVMALGVRSLGTISIALMITWWPTYARLVRGQVLSEREKLYIEAARSSGASDTRILFGHILPNTIQPVIVQATMDIGSVLLVAAGLAFIGFGPPIGTAEWGMMIARGQEYLLSSPWMTLYPGLAILVTALSFNLVGDGIRDIMDPKLRRR